MQHVKAGKPGGHAARYLLQVENRLDALSKSAGLKRLSERNADRVAGFIAELQRRKLSGITVRKTGDQCPFAPCRSARFTRRSASICFCGQRTLVTGVRTDTLILGDCIAPTRIKEDPGAVVAVVRITVVTLFIALADAAFRRNIGDTEGDPGGLGHRCVTVARSIHVLHQNPRPPADCFPTGFRCRKAQHRRTMLHQLGRSLCPYTGVGEPQRHPPEPQTFRKAASKGSCP